MNILKKKFATNLKKKVKTSLGLGLMARLVKAKGAA